MLSKVRGWLHFVVASIFGVFIMHCVRVIIKNFNIVEIVISKHLKESGYSKVLQPSGLIITLYHFTKASTFVQLHKACAYM